MALPVLAIAGIAAAGAIAGSQQDKNGGNSKSSVNPGAESQLEMDSTSLLQQRLKELGGMVDAGPGQSDVQTSLNASHSLADMLKSYSQGGYMPTAADTKQAGSLADQLLNPSFRQQNVEANRLAAQLGRPVDDPIIQAKLRTGLADQRSSFIAQQSMNMPMQRLGFAQDYANVTGGLASQAMTNRQNLMSIGSSLREADRSYRLNIADRTSDYSQYSGGGMKGMIMGGIGGLGAAMGMGGGGAGATASPGAGMAAPSGGGYGGMGAMPQLGSSFGAGGGYNIMTPGSMGGGSRNFAPQQQAPSYNMPPYASQNAPAYNMGGGYF